jgi:hypothetical protein
MAITDFQLHKLGWQSFQDLCTTILTEVLGQTIETYSAAKDGGRDGFFHGPRKNLNGSDVRGASVIQCKFTSKNGRNLSVTDLRSEFPKVRKLNESGLCDHYIVFTNSICSGLTKEALEAEIKEKTNITSLMILDAGWINRTISERPSLRMLVPRVYGLGDLTQILDERLVRQSREIVLSFGDDLQKLVVTESHLASAKALSERGFVILLGQPASGKSTIAASLALGALDRWQCTTFKIHSPEDFKNHWNPDEPKQFFWIDDAFGPTQYDASLTQGWNAILPLISTAIKKGARVLFTSRDYIYRSAQSDLKVSSFPLFQASQVIIELKKLTDMERSQILYNHIKFGDQTKVFKQKIKTYLHEIASNERFLPETARRLGSKHLAPELKSINSNTLRNFVENQVAFMKDTITNLDLASKCALFVLYLNRGIIDRPYKKETSDTLVYEKFGATPAIISQALQSLDDCLTKKAIVEGRSVWSFYHPTIQDAITELCVTNSEWIDLYVHGARLERLLTETTSDPDGFFGGETRLVVPRNLFSDLASRLSPINVEREKLARYLSTRCSIEFLQEWMSQYKHSLSKVIAFTKSINSSFMINFLALVIKNSLAPIAEINVYKDGLLNYIRTNLDISALKDEALLEVFEESTVVDLLTEFDLKIDFSFDDEIRSTARQFDIGSDYDPAEDFSDIRDQIDSIERLIQKLSDARFLNFPYDSIRNQISDANKNIESAIVHLNRRMEERSLESDDEERDWYRPKPVKSHAILPQSQSAQAVASSEATPRVTPSIFDDVDE